MLDIPAKGCPFHLLDSGQFRARPATSTPSGEILFDRMRWNTRAAATVSGREPANHRNRQFENDRSAVSTIVKGVKRAMAGEYSREFSAKVFNGRAA
jgi:hypothetical protein